MYVVYSGVVHMFICFPWIFMYITYAFIVHVLIILIIVSQNMAWTTLDIDMFTLINDSAWYCNVLFTINSTCFDSILIPLSKGAVHWPWQVNQQQGWPVCVVAGWRQEDQHRILKLTHSPPPLVVSLYMVQWLLLVNSSIYIHINVLYITHICIYMHLHHCKNIFCFILFIPSLICYQVKSKFYLTMSMCANVFKVCRVQLLEFGLIVRFLSEVRTHLETHLPRCSRCNDCSCDSLPLACHNERSRAIPRSGLRFLPDKFIS